MRILLLALLLLLALASPAAAWSPDPWTPEQVALEGAYAALVYVDWRQTKATNGGGYDEANPTLGVHPTDAEITRYMVSLAAIHILISAALPSPLRTRWQYLSVGWHSSLVWHNWQIGLTLGF